MQVKRFCGLLLGVLLVLGISSSATGQITAGIAIRVDRPDSGEVVAIGDSIVVRVFNTLAAVPTQVTIKIAIADNDTDTVALDKAGIGASDEFTRVITERIDDPATAAVDSVFRASFVIAPGGPEETKLLAVFVDVVGPGPGTEGGRTTSFSSLDGRSAVSAAPEFGKVGDLKTFGVDGQRPVIGDIIERVYLDANIRPEDPTKLVNDGTSLLTNRGYVPRLLPNTGIIADPPDPPDPEDPRSILLEVGSGRFGFKAGEVMGVNVVVARAAIDEVGLGNLKGVTVFVDTLGATELNARIVVDFGVTDLLFSHKNSADTTDTGIATAFVADQHSNSFIVRKTVTLEADAVNFVGETIVVRATTRDASGNTAGVDVDSEETATVIGVVSEGNFGDFTGLRPIADTLRYKADQQNPVFTEVVPAPGGGRFTGVKTYSYDVINPDGTVLSKKVFKARPISWELSEIADSMTVTITRDDSTRTWTRGAGGTIQAKGAGSLDVAEEAAGNEIMAPDQAGSAVDVTLTAVDSVGNTGTMKITGAVFDTSPLSFGSYFPRAATKSGKDTFNAALSPVIFALNEAADSVLIVYRKLGTAGGTVSTARGAGGGNLNINLTSTRSQKVDVSSDSLDDQTFYALQLTGRDLAYNWTVTQPPDTLFYDVGFKAAQADSILVVLNTDPGAGAVTNDTVVVNTSGTGVTLQIAGWDTVLKATAPEYRSPGLLVTVWSPDPEVDLGGVHISGTGVTEHAALTEGGRKRATLDNEWILGSRTVTVSDTIGQSPLIVSVTDMVSTGNLSGASRGLVYEVGQMTKWDLMAPSAQDTADVRAGSNFMVQVQPQDRFGNPSLKQADLIYTGSDGGNALEVVYLEFSSNSQGVGVPGGTQRIDSTEWTEYEFRAPAANQVVLITARTASSRDGIVVGSTQAKAIGTLHVRTSGAPDVTLPPGDPTVLKPDTFVVENYMGADGMGDQGGFVLATWPNTTQHGQLSAYRIWRFIQVNHGLDDSGALTELTAPAGEWLPWAKVDAVPPIAGAQAVSRAVIPTLDNQQTRWAITAEMGGKPSDATLSLAKVVYSAESVKQTLALLGIRSVMPAEEVLNIFGPSYEYRTSILGDRKDLLLGVLDLDGLRRTAMRLPEGIRAQVAQVRASAATVVAGLAAGTDDLPPAAVSGEEATTDDREVTLTWEVSVDDRIVGLIPYRGYITPIPGVRTYEILRGPDDENLEVVASLSAGSGSFSEVVPEEFGDEFVYRIDATDLDNTTLGQPVLVSFESESRRIKYFTATSTPVFLMLAEGDPHFNLVADLDDFFEFSYNFGQDDAAGNPVLNPQADTNDDGKVNLDDFFAFSESFGLEAEAPSTESAGKIAVQMPAFGANRETGLELKLASARVLPGQPVQVDVTVTDAVDLKGYGFTLTYDAQKFELVEVTPGDDNLLTQGGVTPVFLEVTGPGKVQVANAISGEGSVAGSGTVAQFVFNVKGEFEDAVRFEIDNGILIDGDRLLNPVLTLDVLEIQTTPTEFALRQNYPNPFNPETTIKFDLAESGQVELRIYNIVGQVVRTLVDENQAAGRYSIRWDGRDDRGLTVSSGIYFYSLRADKFRAVKKLMLLK